jgi:hypothetical protein
MDIINEQVLPYNTKMKNDWLIKVNNQMMPKTLFFLYIYFFFLFKKKK